MLLMAQSPFSKRQGYTGQPKEISIREDAPENLRYFVLETAHELGLRPYAMRDITCAVLEKRPNPSNWSEYPNVWNEAQGNVYSCEWFQVYDIIERIWGSLKARDDESSWDEPKASAFEQAINDFFVTKGIGWQLVNGEIVVRGTEAFEVTVKKARAALKKSGRPTASKHIHEALQALSRRPEPDSPGAVYHALGSLECVARDVTGDHKATLGEILKKHRDLVPRPLDEALCKVWGYASNEARHIQEGRELEQIEVELLIGLAATVATYLTKKLDRR
jgi:hypothetical protein